MLKIVISHDVDHLLNREHRFKDLILEKLIVRSIIQFCRGRISFKTLNKRFCFYFKNRFNRIPELISFDKQHGIPSTFFFGMNQGLGMNYKPHDAIPWIQQVREAGLDVGVHTIEIDDFDTIKTEHDTFSSLSGLSSYGTRIHYVRYDEETFPKLARAGYLFDTSEFDKTESSLKQPYMVSDMWEFPLHIMEGYILKEGIEKAKSKTIALFNKAEKMQCEYFTFLFHDSYFDKYLYSTEYEYYKWFVKECEERGYTFVSYSKAIQELNER